MSYRSSSQERLPPLDTCTPRRLHTRYKASQAMFAACPNTGHATVQKWEQGQKKPDGSH